MIHVTSMDDESFLLMVTRSGTVKRIAMQSLRNIRSSGIRAITLEEGDQLVEVRQTNGSQKILIATHDGMAVCFDENDVRCMGRDAVGVGASAWRRATMWWAPPGPRGEVRPHHHGEWLRQADACGGLPHHQPGGKGIKNYAVTEKTGKVVGIKVVDGSEDLLLVTESGIIIRTAVDAIRTAGRATQGVIVMRMREEGDKVISMALAEKEEETSLKRRRRKQISRGGRRTGGDRKHNCTESMPQERRREDYCNETGKCPVPAGGAAGEDPAAGVPPAG